MNPEICMQYNEKKRNAIRFCKEMYSWQWCYSNSIFLFLHFHRQIVKLNQSLVVSLIFIIIDVQSKSFSHFPIKIIDCFMYSSANVLYDRSCYEKKRIFLCVRAHIFFQIEGKKRIYCKLNRNASGYTDINWKWYADRKKTAW